MQPSPGPCLPRPHPLLPLARAPQRPCCLSKPPSPPPSRLQPHRPSGQGLAYSKSWPPGASHSPSPLPPPLLPLAPPEATAPPRPRPWHLRGRRKDRSSPAHVPGAGLTLTAAPCCTRSAPGDHGFTDKETEAGVGQARGPQLQRSRRAWAGEAFPALLAAQHRLSASAQGEFWKAEGSLSRPGPAGQDWHPAGGVWRGGGIGHLEQPR